MLTPTPKQIEIRDTAALDLVVVAPAGCGKTEALALRIQGLLNRGAVTAPQKILVTTFSNRARDNIRERLGSYLPAAQMRDRVSVSNFHGIAARLFRAHANVIDMDPELIIPEGDWVGDELRRRGVPWNSRGPIQDILRGVKLQPLDDAAVEAELVRRGDATALSIEQDRKAQGRLAYDDLPRLAELILANEEVAELYRAHFGAVVVDEFQDLTPQQLRIVNRIGFKRTTFAGDLAQGIYGFTGAKPSAVDAYVRAECGTTVQFSESHRSSPAVLNVVNALDPLTGGQPLTCADPTSWPSGGLAALVHHDHAAREAAWIADVSRAILSRVPNQRIGVIARTAGRRAFADAAFAASDIEPFRWDDGVVDTDTAQVVRAMLASFDLVGFTQATDKSAFLRWASNFESISDVDGRKNLADALIWVHDRLDEALPPADIRARVRTGDSDALISKPGVHLLTGHAGKGQQFDWVFVAGLEEDILPDFRDKTPEGVVEEARVLSVMISRARHGVIICYSDDVPPASGKQWIRKPSRFLTLITTAAPLDATGMVEWFQTADWDAIAKR
jgi:DNA helicase-2/ATP-dependent DNA helicase PcrA